VCVLNRALMCKSRTRWAFWLQLRPSSSRITISTRRGNRGHLNSKGFSKTSREVAQWLRLQGEGSKSPSETSNTSTRRRPPSTKAHNVMPSNWLMPLWPIPPAGPPSRTETQKSQCWKSLPALGHTTETCAREHRAPTASVLPKKASPMYTKDWK